MADASQPRDDEILRSLVGQIPASGSPCLSADQAAAYAEGALLREERGAVETHLAGCGSCSAEIGQLIQAGLGASQPARGAQDGLRRAKWGRFRPRHVAAAAILVIVAGGARLILDRWRAPSAEGRLVAEVAELRRRHANVFGGFAPVGPEERRAVPATDAMRSKGGLAILVPAGKALPDIASIILAVPSTASTYAVIVINEAGDTVRSFKGAVMPEPPQSPLASLNEGPRSVCRVSLSPASPTLPAGSYLLEVTVSSPLGDATERRPFEVVRDDEHAALDEGRRIIDSTVAPELRALIIAHFAWRRGFTGDALTWAAEAQHADPANRVARETVLALRARVVD